MKTVESKEKPLSDTVGLFSRLQVRYRSFRDVGNRFGAVKYDPRDQKELELARMHRVDNARSQSLHRALNDALK